MSSILEQYENVLLPTKSKLGIQKKTCSLIVIHYLLLPLIKISQKQARNSLIKFLTRLSVHFHCLVYFTKCQRDAMPNCSSVYEWLRSGLI